jgi:hypothetical protein
MKIRHLMMSLLILYHQNNLLRQTSIMLSVVKRGFRLPAVDQAF